MPPVLTTRAPAKINLTLRVVGRRDDGYHELESLVAFAGVGDALSLSPGPADALTIAGPFGRALTPTPDNLVLRAVRLLREEVPALRSGQFHLVKRLPVASGIGGGSADAAAALRLLARLNGIAAEDPVLYRTAARIGADVPVCLAAQARIMSGIGERLGPALRLPRLFAVLVNPGVPVETVAVFRALGLANGQNHEAGGALPMPPVAGLTDATALVGALAASGNDLQRPALALEPVIDTVLETIAMLPGCRLARMSGSGATCFGVFDDCGASASAAKALARDRPGWWIKATVLR